MMLQCYDARSHPEVAYCLSSVAGFFHFPPLALINSTTIQDMLKSSLVHLAGSLIAGVLLKVQIIPLVSNLGQDPR